MDWVRATGWPATLLLVLAALAALWAIGKFFVLRRRLGEHRPVSATWHALGILLLLAIALAAGGAAMALRGWQRLAAETPVLALAAHHVGDQRWQLDLAFPDGTTRRVTLQGDAWRVEAIVLKWQLPAWLAGVPPLYRLDRLSSRYADAAQAAEIPPTVIPLGQAGPWDIATLRARDARWLPMVDTVFGSGVYLPLVDGAHYRVSLMASGALVARQDDAAP